MVGKSEEVSFKAQKKLITRKTECSARVEEVELMTMVEWCVSGAKDLRFIGREFRKRGEELRNDRSTNLSQVETGGRKDTDYLRNEFCWEV